MNFIQNAFSTVTHLLHSNSESGKNAPRLPFKSKLYEDNEINEEETNTSINDKNVEQKESTIANDDSAAIEPSNNNSSENSHEANDNDKLEYREIICDNEIEYEGFFHNEIFSGFGKKIFPNHEEWEVKQSKKTGEWKGTILFARIFGKGKITYPDRTVQKGLFKKVDNSFVCLEKINGQIQEIPVRSTLFGKE